MKPDGKGFGYHMEDQALCGDPLQGAAQINSRLSVGS